MFNLLVSYTAYRLVGGMSMKKINKKTFWIILSIVILVTTAFVKDFYLSWVEVYEDYAEVTINFLLPMDKTAFNKHIELLSELPEANQFSCQVHWFSDKVVQLKISEENQIKGQRVKLRIKNTPTCYSWLSKSLKLTIPFKTEVQLKAPEDNVLIASTGAFKVQFNTPMNKHKLSEYIECDAMFQIEPCKKLDANGQEYEDLSCFLFTPKAVLENGRNYILSFKKGMPSQNGTFLAETCYRMISVDQKPEILKTYPAQDDKWIGLYPRFILESDTPIKEAELILNGVSLQGKVQNQKKAYFTAPNLLKPETTYEAVFQVTSASGEKSLPQKVAFTSTNIEPNRIWLIVQLAEPHTVNCYNGTKKIKSFPCILGEGENAPLLGTYYLQNKQEVYEDEHIGANYYLEVYEKCGIQGMMRNSYWQLEEGLSSRMGGNSQYRNIILYDEDARWLYENLPYDTMIIIKNK